MKDLGTTRDKVVEMHLSTFVHCDLDALIWPFTSYFAQITPMDLFRLLMPIKPLTEDLAFAQQVAQFMPFGIRSFLPVLRPSFKYR